MAGQPESQEVPAAAERAAMLEGLLAREGEGLRRLALANSSNPCDAEDALQEGCLAFLRYYEGGEDGALPWLRLVVRRFAWRIGSAVRRRGSRRYVATVEPGEPTGHEVVPADPGPGTHELVEGAEALQRRIELLGELKPDERATLILIGLGLTYREIGELRGWTHTKINRCAAEGRARLRELERAEGERT